MKRISLCLFAALLVLCSLCAHSQSFAPFGGLGNAQFFDNNGKPLTAGMLYSFAAGTSTQQATYTDSTGSVLNPNPIPFGSGARVNIWLNAALFYKLVLCTQNDGAACAPADILFSVDNVPGGPGAGATSNFTGTFVSGSPLPATTGILRLASVDQICWRNAAGTANLCISKDANDVLSWSGGTMKFPEQTCSNTGSGFDYLCADSTTHHWKFAGNGGAQFILPGLTAVGTPLHMVQLASNGIDMQDSGELMTVLAAAPFNATPTFTATGQNQLFTMTLTGNVTSSTLIATTLVPPAYITFQIKQDGTGGRTFVWPSNVVGALTPASNANALTVETFVWDGANANYIAPPCTTQTKTSSYTLQSGDCVIQASVAGGSFSLLLPHLVSGQQWTISRSDSSTNTLTVAMDNGNHVNSGNSFTMSPFSTAICHSDGSQGWCNISIFTGGVLIQFGVDAGCTAGACSPEVFPIPYQTAVPLCFCTGINGSCNQQTSGAVKTSCAFNASASGGINWEAIGVP